MHSATGVPSAATQAPCSGRAKPSCHRPLAVAIRAQKSDVYCNPQPDRRGVGVQLLSAAAAAALAASAPALPAAATDSLTPFQRGFALEYGLTQEGRIRSCPTDANPNCVSTSATNMVRPLSSLEEPASCHLPSACCIEHSVRSSDLMRNLHPRPPAKPLQTYMPAWEAPQGNLGEAMAQLEAALRRVAPEAALVDSSSSPAAEYRRWQVPDRLFDHDDVE